MFRNLRVKMVGATMMTLMVVLIVITTAANLFNYREMVIETDLTLSILASNEGNSRILLTSGDGRISWIRRSWHMRRVISSLC